MLRADVILDTGISASSFGRIRIVPPCHIGAKSALLRRSFIPVGQKRALSARPLASPFQITTASLGCNFVKEMVTISPRRVARQFEAKRRIAIGGIHFRRKMAKRSKARRASRSPKKEGILKNKNITQRSGCVFERRSDKVNERRRLLGKRKTPPRTIRCPRRRGTPDAIRTHDLQSRSYNFTVLQRLVKCRKAA